MAAFLCDKRGRICYSPRMTQSTPARKRLAESRVGMVIALLLCLIWLVSMAVVDGHASSFYPVGWALVVVAVLALCAVAGGYKVVKMSHTGWFCLAVGVYYLTRCMLSPVTVSSWYETGLILGGFAFYLFGLYAAQGRGHRLLLVGLVAAVLLNTVALYVMGETEVSVRILGRPEVSLCGANSRNVTLFVYKNFAGMVLSLCGMLLLWYAVWRGKWGWRNVLMLLMGVAGIVASLFCQTRVVWLILPVAGGVGSLLWVLMTMGYKRTLSGLQMLLCAMILVAFAVFVVDCVFSRHLLDILFGVDSHLRFAIWAEAWAVVGDAPLWGYGAESAQWLMSAVYNEWQLPNYVHNEYLQAWVDYGIIGVALLFLLIVASVTHGVYALVFEHVCVERKLITAVALVCIACVAAAAFTDFVWHNFAIVSMTAFACGVVASPFPRPALRLFDFRNWAPESRNHVHALKAQSGVLKLLLMTALLGGGLIAAGLCLKLRSGFKAQWDYDELVENGASNKQRRAFLCEAVINYPDSEIADHYALMGGGNMFWPAYEQMLRLILQHNPYQIFTAAMLGDVLGRQQRFAEAEAVFRRYYPGDGPENSMLNLWTVYYTTNLYAWAQHLISEGCPEKALSMMQYADTVSTSGLRPATYPSQFYRAGTHCWVDGGSKHRRNFIRNCKTDRTVLEAIGVTPDHSWRAPLEPGGKPALYSRFVRMAN